MDEVRSLWHISLEYCAKNLETFCTYDSQKKKFSLAHDVSLSSHICNALLKTFVEFDIPFSDEICHIFADTAKCQIIFVNVQGTDITDDGARWLLSHNPVEVDFTGCRNLTPNLRNFINKHGKNLRSLNIGKTHIFNNELGSGDCQWVLNLPTLKKLSLQECIWTNLCDLDGPTLAEMMCLTLQPLRQLNFLDLSSWPGLGDHLKVIKDMTFLRTLILADVKIENFGIVCDYICHLENLQ